MKYKKNHRANESAECRKRLANEYEYNENERNESAEFRERTLANRCQYRNEKIAKWMASECECKGKNTGK